MDGVLASGEGADFFHDEYRCPVFVKDVVQVIQLLMQREAQAPMQVVMNVGGPERLSRAAMAETVAKVRGYDTALVRKISSKTTANRGVVSPGDISMDVSKVGADLNFKLTDFATAVALTFNEGCYPTVFFKKLIQVSLLKQVTRRSRLWSNSGQGSPNGVMAVLIVSTKPSLKVFTVLNSPAMLNFSTSTTSSSS